MKKYNKFFKEKAISMKMKGVSVYDIANKCHVGKSTLYRWFNKRKCISNNSYESTVKNAIALFKNNIPIKTISSKLNISKSTLYYWYNKYNNTSKYKLTSHNDNLKHLKLQKKVEILQLLSPINKMKTREKIEAIKSLVRNYNITLLCEIFCISKTTYYRYLSTKPTKNEIRDNFLRKEILQIYQVNKKMIGGIKIKEVLNEKGLNVSKKKVYQLMNDLNISKQVKKRNPYLRPKKKTNSKCKNILNQRFNPLEPNLVWVSDVTEVKIRSKPVYLCIIMDLFARKIIGHTISIKNNTRLAELTFKNALYTRTNKVPVLFHSDRGSIYTSYRFRQLLQKYHITQSFSKAGYPYDNSPMESFFSQYKRETKQERDSISTIQKYKVLVQEYIEFYNEFRFHSGIGLLTPNKKEELYDNFYIKNSKPLK